MGKGKGKAKGKKRGGTYHITMQSNRSLSVPLFLVIAMIFVLVREPLLTLTTTLSSFVVSAQEEGYQSSWQSCSTFLTPNMGGWAVYAARSFKEDELVELTPFFIPLETHYTKHSVLDNYVFNFQRDTDTVTDSDTDSNSNSKRSYNVVLLGNGAFYNHHPHPNLKYVQVVQKEGMGDDNDKDNNNIPHLVGFRSTRDIFPGEQLYVSYGDDYYSRRGLKLDDAQIMTEESIESYMLPFYLSKHCSKIYGGVGLPTWRDTVLPIVSGMRYNNKNNNGGGGGAEIMLDPSDWMDLSRLAPFDAGLSDARAKVDTKKGEHIEKSLGLVISRNDVRGTPLGPIAFYWENLKVDHHQHLINLRDDEKLMLQYQGSDTNWKSIDRFLGYSEITILPVSGNIGLVRRVGSSSSSSSSGGSEKEREEYNCRLMIRSNEDYQTNHVGVTLELIATKDISAGDVLKVNIAPSEFEEEYRLLHDEMEQSGQPHHPGIFDSIIQQEEEEL